MATGVAVTLHLLGGRPSLGHLQDSMTNAAPPSNGLQPRKRPDWDTYFLQQAFLVATRSPDVHTQHGCIIIDDQKRVVSQVNLGLAVQGILAP